MEWMAKKIRKEAIRNKLGMDDLINAVSAVQYQQQGDLFDAQLHKDVIQKDTVQLWEVAGDIVQYFKENNF